jgi:hypothetical protein
MSSLDVNCDGSKVYPEFSGHIVTKTWDTGIRVVVPPDQFCWFLPADTSKFRQVVLPFVPENMDQQQPLILTCKKKLQVRVKQGKALGTLHFFKAIEAAHSIKLEWDHKE